MTKPVHPYHRLAPGISERVFQQRIVDLAVPLGLKVFHSGDSRRDLCAGYPDLTIVGTPSRGVLFAELKTTKGRVSTEQQQWVNAINNSFIGAERLPLNGTVYLQAVVWRPRDWESQEIQRTLHRLAGRRYFDPMAGWTQ